MNKYFIDTSYLVAYSYDKDKYHVDAKREMKKIEKEKTSTLFTSDYVIDEFLNILIRISGINQATKWGKLLFSEKFIQILEVVSYKKFKNNLCRFYRSLKP